MERGGHLMLGGHSEDVAREVTAFWPARTGLTASAGAPTAVTAFSHYLGLRRSGLFRNGFSSSTSNGAPALAPGELPTDD